MKRRILIICTSLLLTNLALGQTLYSDMLEFCDKKTTLFVNYQKVSDVFNININDNQYLFSIIKVKNSNIIKDSILSKLRRFDKVCVEQDKKLEAKIESVSNLIFKRKDIKIGDTRKEDIGKLVLKESIDTNYIYQIKYSDDQKIIPLLNFENNKYTLNIDKVKNEPLFTENIIDILKFIYKNDEIKIPYYLVEEKDKSFLVFNAEIDDSKLTGGDFIEINSVQAIKYIGSKKGYTDDDGIVFAYNIFVPEKNKDGKEPASLTNRKICNDENGEKKYGISYIIGLGGVFGFKRYYQMPVIDPIEKKVKMDQAQPSGLNASIGIVYSPYYSATKSLGNVQRGTSFAAFFNPLNILSSSNKIQDNFSLENFGIGVGWKCLPAFSIFGTLEAFSIKQPRQWFIDKFSNNSTQYILQVNGAPQIQSAIDEKDNNVFEKKYILGIGLKICYSFDIVKELSSSK